MIVNRGANTEQKTVVIIGVQRGGTSMVAGVVRELGVFLGQKLGNNHEDPEFITKDLRDIRSVVQRRNSEYDVWGWKMPHSSEYIVDLLPHLRNPFVIVVFRNLISMAESQMRRSDATFDQAFLFSADRTAQVSDATLRIRSPLMLVNYEKAVSVPQKLIDELCAFLYLKPAVGTVENALAMVNPDRGYARLKKEDWSFTVEQGNAVDGLTEITPRRKNFDICAEGGSLVRVGDNPRIEFSDFAEKSERVYLSMTRDGGPDFIRVAVSAGNGYSDGLTDTIPLYSGRNVVKIRAHRVAGVMIYPQFDGETSNVRLIRVYQ